MFVKREEYFIIIDFEKVFCQSYSVQVLREHKAKDNM